MVKVPSFGLNDTMRESVRDSIPRKGQFELYSEDKRIPTATTVNKLEISIPASPTQRNMGSTSSQFKLTAKKFGNNTP